MGDIMEVTKEILNQVIYDYNIRPGKPDGLSRKRLAIIIGGMLIENGMPARDAAIMERVFYDELDGVELISGMTDYEEYLGSLKGYQTIDPLKIGLPESIAYTEEARLKAFQIIQYIERRTKDEIREPINRRNIVRGIGHELKATIRPSTKGLAVHSIITQSAGL
jgi:hypothetical protein